MAGRAEVLLDGGVRNGIDVVRALSLGARACLLGRPWAYALAAQGEEGVSGMLATLRRELTTTLTLAGLTSVQQLGRQALA